MTIAIDIRVLSNNIRSGVEEYTENLLAHLLPLDEKIKFKLFFSSARRKLKDYPWMSSRNVGVYKFKWPNDAIFLANRVLGRPYLDKLIGGADVFFSPHIFLSSLSRECKRVTAFHDLSYLYYPEFFSLRQNIWHNFQMHPSWQLRFSEKIIAVSESTKNDIISHCGIDPTKIEVIYSGVSCSRPADEELNKFKIKNNIPEKFILFLGKIEPRKNIAGLIRTFEILKSDKNFKNFHLLIAGAKGWLYKNIFLMIENSKFKKQIIWLNYIKDEDRKFYYSLASVFVYPSFFEGFGFPPLEAMSCGTPVVCSFSSSLSEVTGDGVLLVDPFNSFDIASAIKNILNDKTLLKRLNEKSSKTAVGFNWRKTAEETLNILVNV